MLARARELGFRTFLGCMEETSVAIAASAAVASLADWVDLDGNLLLADDPFERPRARRGPPLAAHRRARAWGSRRARAGSDHRVRRSPVNVSADGGPCG